MAKYDIKKGLMKFVKVAVPVIIAGVASVYGNNQLYLAIAPVLAFVGNYVKHNLGTDLKLI